MSHRLSAVLLLFPLFWVNAAHAQHAPRDPPSWMLSVDDRQMTAAIDRVPLHLVLEQLSHQVPLRLTLGENWRDYLVTAHFRALPLDEALARLLTGLPYGLIIYDPAPSAASAATKPVVELLLTRRPPPSTATRASDAPAIAINPAERQTGMLEAPPEWAAVLQHPDPVVRIQALQRWAEQDTPTVLNPLTQALVDPDESVRTRAQALVERVWTGISGTDHAFQ
jgi:hypothetical protein